MLLWRIQTTSASLDLMVGAGGLSYIQGPQQQRLPWGEPAVEVSLSTQLWPPVLTAWDLITPDLFSFSWVCTG